MKNDILRVAICDNDKYFSQIRKEILTTKDMRLVGIFTRDPKKVVASEEPYIRLNDMESWQEKIDVIIICGGTELHQQIPDMAKLFNIVNAFDSRATNPVYLKAMHENATMFKHTVIMFKTEKILSIKGVKDAVEYVTEDEIRECYVVAEDEADTDDIWYQIMVMYEDDKNIEIHFITEEELKEKTSIIKRKEAGIEYSLKMNCGAESTAASLVSFARATQRINKDGGFGVKVPFDISPSILSTKTRDELLQELMSFM